MYTIVLAHPWHGSYNKAILDRVIEVIETKGESYRLIDLNKDGFDPVLKEEELKLFSRGEAIDPLVKNYQEALQNTEKLIFIFPIWWYSGPAILKGFFDKVFLKGFAYENNGPLLKGKLQNIKSSLVITTSDGPSWFYRLFAGNPIKRVITGSTLKIVGIKRIKWINSDLTSSPDNSKRDRFLKNLGNYI